MNANFIFFMRKWLLGYLCLLFIIFGCKKLAKVDAPVTNVTGQSVFQSDVTAIALLTSIYAKISSTPFNDIAGLTSITKKTGLSGDEFSLSSDATILDLQFYQNNLIANYTPTGPDITGFEYWNICYSYIFTCNAAIEGLRSSTSLTPAVSKQLLGEARFLRAFCYFYLANLYGDVPLVITTDYEVNRLLPKSAKAKVYDQVISDLQEAKKLLADNYLDGTLLKPSADRVRPTHWAAEALLARVLLYTGDYGSAELAATNVINHASLFNLTPLEQTFLANSAESIWQLQPVNLNGDQFWNTEDAKLFVLTADPIGLSSDKPVYLSPSLLAAFENGDNRLITWVGLYTDGSGSYYFPYKYRVAAPESSVTEYLTVLRLAEQYLIRAEARAQQNNISGAQNDLNFIRTRAGLPQTNASDKTALLTAILHERQVELFAEWGHRWFDLKRTGNIDVVMSIVTPSKANGAPWRSFQQWYPLPAQDIERNPNLTQNAGY